MKTPVCQDTGYEIVKCSKDLLRAYCSGSLKLSTSFNSAKFGKVKNYSKPILCCNYFFKPLESGLLENWVGRFFNLISKHFKNLSSICLHTQFAIYNFKVVITRKRRCFDSNAKKKLPLEFLLLKDDPAFFLIKTSY